MRRKTALLSAVALGWCVAGCPSALRGPSRRGAPPGEKTVPVLWTRQKVQPWQAIKDPEKYFEVKEVREADAPRRALRGLDQVKGRELNKVVGQGKPVTEDDLLSKDQFGGSSIGPGRRAVAIKLNPEHSLNGIVPGVRVDVAVTPRGRESEAMIFLRDMLILAVKLIDRRDPDQSLVRVPTVTLAATPEEATKLALAGSAGELRLLLRPGGK